MIVRVNEDRSIDFTAKGLTLHLDSDLEVREAIKELRYALFALSKLTGVEVDNGKPSRSNPVVSVRG